MVLREQHGNNLVQQEPDDLRVRKYVNSDSQFSAPYLCRMQFVPCRQNNLDDFVSLQRVNR